MSETYCSAPHTFLMTGYQRFQVDNMTDSLGTVPRRHDYRDTKHPLNQSNP